MFEEQTFCAVEGENRFHGVLDRVNEAGGTLGVLFDPDVEPDGRVEGGSLMEEKVGQFVVKDSGLFRRFQDSVFDSPGSDGIRHTRYQLANAGLSFRGSGMASEVLTGDDLNRLTRPRRWSLDVGLKEDVGAVGSCDANIGGFPGDSIENRRVRVCEMSSEFRHSVWTVGATEIDWGFAFLGGRRRRNGRRRRHDGLLTRGANGLSNTVSGIVGSTTYGIYDGRHILHSVAGVVGLPKGSPECPKSHLRCEPG